MSTHYDFDIHKKGSYMYFWTQRYMDATLKAAKHSEFDWKGKTLLDIGVGRGRALALYKQLCIKHVIGIDVNEKETALAQNQAKRTHIDLQLVIDDMNNTALKELKANYYDIIALMNILFCVPNDTVRKTIIRESIRLLKPGGRLIVLDMQRPSLMWLFSTLTGKEWKFRTHREVLTLFSPLKLITTEPSNFFYFINAPLNMFSRLIGSSYFEVCDRLFKAVGVPPSTKTFIFTK